MDVWRRNKITLKKIWSNVMETLDRQPLKHLLLESRYSLALLSRYNKTGTWRLQKDCLFFRVVILEHFVACVWNWDKTMAILKINEKRQNLKTKQFKNSKHRSPYWKNRKTLHQLINLRGKRKYTYNLVVVVGMQFQLCVMLLSLQLCSLVTWP